MRIGIDIDDTITNSWQYQIPIYEEIFDIKISENSEPYYGVVKDKLPLQEFFAIVKSHEDKLYNVPLKEDVKEILTKLKQEGNTIIFITTRGGTYTDSYKTTKEYLDKNLIPYDKLIVGIYEKDKTCQEEKIDLFIDDSKKHCEEVTKIGIDVLMMEANYNKNNNDFKRVKNWQEVYEYIKNR